MKKSGNPTFYLTTIESFIASSPLFQTKRPCPDSDLAFALAALIFPKDLASGIKASATRRLEIQEVQNYMYKFSLERLSKFICSPPLAYLLSVYLQAVVPERFLSNPVMAQYREAYMEAGVILVREASKTLFGKAIEEEPSEVNSDTIAA